MLNKQHQSKWTQMDCEDDQQIQVYKPYSPIPCKKQDIEHKHQCEGRNKGIAQILLCPVLAKLRYNHTSLSL